MVFRIDHGSRSPDPAPSTRRAPERACPASRHLPATSGRPPAGPRFAAAGHCRASRTRRRYRASPGLSCTPGLPSRSHASRRKNVLRCGISSRRSRSGGTWIRIHTEPVEQVLAKLSRRRRAARGRRWSPPRRERRRAAARVSPTGSTSPCSRKRSSFGWTSSGQVADFVEEQRAADRRPQNAGLVGVGAGKTPAAMAEQLAVGQFPCGAGAVVGEEHAGATQRAGVDGAGDEVLAGAAFAGDQHRQIVALQALDLVGDTMHRAHWRRRSRAATARAAARVPRSPVPASGRVPGTTRIPGAARRRASGSAGAPPRGQRPRDRDDCVTCAFDIATDRFDCDEPRCSASPPRRAQAARLRRRRFAARRRRARESGRRGVPRPVPRRSASQASRSALRLRVPAAPASPTRLPAAAPAHRPHPPGHRRSRRSRRLPTPRATASVSAISRGAERFEEPPRIGQVASGPRTCAGAGRQPPELEIPERRLVTLAEQLEDAHALAEIVVRLSARVRPRRGAGRGAAGTLPTCRSSRRARSGSRSPRAVPAPQRSARRASSASTAVSSA